MGFRGGCAAGLVLATIVTAGGTVAVVEARGLDEASGMPVRSSPPALPGPTAAPQRPAPHQLVSGIDIPWGLAFLPDGDALVGERDTGRVLQVPRGGGQPREVARLGVKLAFDEGGLLGLAVSPTYSRDRYVYAYLTTVRDNRIVRFRLDRPRQAEPVLTAIGAATSHNGGRLAFGPDGMLYATTGDINDPARAQNRANLNGKILRLRPDGSPAPGNPFPGSPVYSYGHRNVQGLAWDDAGRLYATEFGQQAVDEVNRIEPGGNYGWPTVEGTGDTAGGRYRNPLLTWPTGQASPSGAVIVANTLYVAALRGERLWAVPLDGRGGVGPARSLLDGRYGRLRTIARAPDGAVWVCTSNRDRRGTLRPGDDRILRFAPAELAWEAQTPSIPPP